MTTPTPLITGFTPRLAYNEEGEVALTLVWRQRQPLAKAQRLEEDVGV